MYNLTDEQKESLRWIVNKVRNNELNSVFVCVFLFNGEFARFQGKGENITGYVPITEEILESLKASQMIFLEKNRNVFRCGLLGDNAYKAVDNNFQEIIQSDSTHKNTQIYKYIYAVILLVLTLLGFKILPWYGAILWLLFLIIAYPIAIAFTATDKSMDTFNLIELYKLGVNQLPYIEKITSFLQPKK